MDRKKFYDALRSSSVLFGKTLNAGQVASLEVLLDEGQRRKVELHQLSYILATAYGEAGSALKPISENMNYTADRIRQVWPSRFASVAAAKPYAKNPQKLANKVYGGRMGNTAADDGWRYRGRGLVQITGKDNYTKFGIAANPDKALELSTAVSILFDGILGGKFTGAKLVQYVQQTHQDYTNARRVVNGTFEAAKYAKYAVAFESALKAAGYKTNTLVDISPSGAKKESTFTTLWHLFLYAIGFGK